MLVSYKLLSTLVDLKEISAQELAKKLTFAGIEVEGVSCFASATKLVIGEVIECSNHPDSDHLHLLKVNCGTKVGIKQIVCGAPNAKKGLKVIVALDGAELPGGVIKEGVIRGQTSQGMCCSLLELGVDRKYLTDYQINGIEELPLDAVVGNEEVLNYLGLDDSILDLSILPNRSDCYALINLAREVKTLFDRPLNIPEVKDLQEVKTLFITGSATSYCPQFSIKVVKDIKIKESPKWLKEALNASGVRSINNIVDIGNYIMLLTGQPLHMYDLDKLEKEELIVKDDYEGEFVALDEKTYLIKKGDLVVTCNNKPLCLAGVMGSLDSEVDENSKNIAIEAANFNHASIRKTSTRLGLVSESSSRFTRKINPSQYDYVLNITAQLVKELAEGKIVEKTSTYDVENHDPLYINTSISYINKRLGTTFTPELIVTTLTKDGFEIEQVGDSISCKVPSFRIDVTCNADISEEVIRLLGFDHVSSLLPLLETTVGGQDEEHKKARLIEEHLRALGLYQTITYSLVREKENKKFTYLSAENPVKLLNPMTEEHEEMRLNLLDSSLRTVSFNTSRQATDFGIFEISDVYSTSSSSTRLCISLVGKRHIQGNLLEKEYSFYSLKGLLESILSLLGIEHTRYSYKPLVSDKNEFHPGRSATLVVQGKVAAVLGELHPSVYKEYGIKNEKIYSLELNLSYILSLKTSLKKMTPINKYPSITRDLALVMKKDYSYESLLKAIRNVGKGIVTDVQVFDIYQGEGLKEDEKSVAISVTYSNIEKTLKDEEVKACEDKILADLAKYGISRRS